MIHLAFHQLFLIPVVVGLTAVLGAWVYYSFKSSRAYNRTKSTARLYRCEHCTRVYLDHREVPLTRCPGCGALNEAVRQ